MKEDAIRREIAPDEMRNFTARFNDCATRQGNHLSDIIFHI